MAPHPQITYDEETNELTQLKYRYGLFVSVYVENARSTAAVTMAISQSTGGNWNIKVTHIECTSHSRAPADCNAYYTGLSGSMTSYNWPNVQLKSTTTTHCIRPEAGKI